MVFDRFLDAFQVIVDFEFNHFSFIFGTSKKRFRQRHQPEINYFFQNIERDACSHFGFSDALSSLKTVKSKVFDLI